MIYIPKPYLELVQIMKQVPTIKELLEELIFGTHIVFSFDGEENYSKEIVEINSVETLKKAKQYIQNYNDDGTQSGILGYEIIGVPLTREIMESFFYELYKFTSTDEFIKNAGYSNREDLIETKIRFDYSFSQGRSVLMNGKYCIGVLDSNKAFWQQNEVLFELLVLHIKEKKYFNF